MIKDATQLTSPSAWAEIYFSNEKVTQFITPEDQKKYITTLILYGADVRLATTKIDNMYFLNKQQVFP